MTSIPKGSSGDKTLYAKWTINSYTVTWKNADGSTLKTDTVEYGKTPSYSGTPTKAADAQYSYTFSGWSPAVSAVTSDTTYTAQFSSTVNKYNITLPENMEFVPASETSKFDYDSTVSFKAKDGYTASNVKANGSALTADENGVYTVTVEGDVTVSAEFAIPCEPITYIGENGEEVTVTDYTVLTGNETANDGGDIELQGGIYVVDGTVTYQNPLWLDDNTVLILKDGAKLNITSSDGITISSTLYVYGQHDGTGELNINANECGISGFYDNSSLYLYGGNITANMTWGHIGIKVDQVYLGGATLAANKYHTSTVHVMDGLIYSDGTNLYSGTLTAEQISALGYKTLVRAYAVNLPESTTGGSITADKSFVAANAADKTVTLTVTPNEGYAVKSVSVNGEVIEPVEGVYSFEMPAKGVTVSAEFEKQKFTVTWKNGDTVLETDENIEYGTTPTYDRGTPTKDATAQYTYTFSGWSPAVGAVTGNTEYTEQFDSIVNEYTVTWINGNGNTLKTEQVAYGETPAYTGNTPTKTATAQFSYTFTGWDTTPSAVTGNATYTVQFSETVNQYTVKWVDGNSNTLKTETLDYGATSTAYNGETPTKTPTAQYTYTFKGWDEELSAITGDTTYTAQFDSEVNKYTVTWKNGSTILETDTEVPYGATPTYNGTTPTKASTSSYTYSFAGWSPAVSSVKGDVTYTATFTAHSTYVPPTYYTITYKVDGKVYQTASSTSGSKITLIDEPTKEGYTFSGWQTSYTTMPASNIEITGTFTINTYAVNFVDADDVTVLADTQAVSWNEKASAPDTPTKDGFVFLYWTADGTTEYDFETAVTDNLTLRAVWKEAVNATVQLDVSSGIVGGKNSLIYVSYAGDLSEGCTVTSVGFYVATNKFLGFTDDNTTNVMDLDGYDVKEIMKNNTTGLVKEYVKAESTHELQLRVGANTSYYFYVLPYVVVTDESGNEYVFYGDVSAATFDSVQ